MEPTNAAASALATHAVMPLTGGRATTAPGWMDAPLSLPEMRRKGHAHGASGSGLQTALFFGLIVAVVAIAGTVGVAIWGPETTVRSGSRLAMRPAPIASFALPEFSDTSMRSAATAPRNASASSVGATSLDGTPASALGPATSEPMAPASRVKRR